MVAFAGQDKLFFLLSALRILVSIPSIFASILLVRSSQKAALTYSLPGLLSSAKENTTKLFYMIYVYMVSGRRIEDVQRLTRMKRFAQEKVWGSPVNITEAREILPTDQIGPGGYAGVYVYQQTERTIDPAAYEAFVNGDMQTLRDEIHKAIPNGPTIVYMRFSWNVVSDTTIRDLAVGFVMTVDQQFTAQQVIDAAKTVAWFNDFFSQADMGIVNAWLLTVEPGVGGIPWNVILVVGVGIVALIFVAKVPMWQ